MVGGQREEVAGVAAGRVGAGGRRGQIVGEDGPQAQHVGVQRQGGRQGARHGQLSQGVVPAVSPSCKANTQNDRIVPSLVLILL